MLYTNSTGQDTVRTAFYECTKKPCRVLIAAPFFSYDSLVNDILARKCEVRLIVRLGPSTSPDSLKTLIKRQGVQIRFFTSPRFHSKLYIFGQQMALVGSANLTQSGMQSNREICVGISVEDDRFEDLVLLFQSYWNDADVLTDERLEEYSRICRSVSSSTSEHILEKAITEEFGDLNPSGGIIVGGKKQSSEKLYLESYRQVYQEFLTAYREVEEIYSSKDKRQLPENVVPLRIEVDQFFSFVREKFAGGDTYREQPLRYGEERKVFVSAMIDKWFKQRWSYLDEKVQVHFSMLNKSFSSKEVIESTTTEEIYDALEVCNAFHDRYRFYKGGGETKKREFLENNSQEQLKKVVAYLLFGEGNYIDRMGICIFDPEYKLWHYGRSCIQELLGWINKENIPICNGRTVKALRYLGFDVVIFT